MFSQYSYLVKRIFDIPIQVSSGPDEEHEIDRDIGTITKEKEPELKKINIGNMPDEGYLKSIKNEKK